MSDDNWLRLADHISKQEALRLQRLTNQDLIQECMRTDAANFGVVAEMMRRLRGGVVLHMVPEKGEQRPAIPMGPKREPMATLNAAPEAAPR